MELLNILIEMFLDIGKIMLSLFNVITSYSIRIFFEINSKLHNPLLSIIATILLASLVFMVVSFSTKLMNNIVNLVIIILIIAVIILLLL